MKIDSILLDLDGTLWDSVAGVAQAWQSVIDQYNIGISINNQQIEGCMGFSLPEIGERLFPNVPEKKREHILRECLLAEYAYLHEHGGTIYSGVKETLAELAEQYKLAIVSNCEEGYIECFLKVNDLDHLISDYESFGHTGKSKGENIRLVMNRLQSAGAIYVGDMIKDSQAAEEAGIPYIYARYGFGKGILQPRHWDYTIDSFPELSAIVQKIVSSG